MWMTYDIESTYEQNYRSGPVLPPDFAWPEEPLEGPSESWLGIPVRSRFGVAAGLLLNSDWVATYARLGFDLLTYKTVRNMQRDCHPMPNWVWLEPVQEASDAIAVMRSSAPERPEEAHAAICYGMPSRAPDLWMKDVTRAASRLYPGQVLIVSVTASPSPGGTLDGLMEDFVLATTRACQAGAQVVEANLSCPNVCSAEGTIYLNAEASGIISKAIRQAAGSVPVLLKIGHIAREDAMSAFIDAVAPHVDGLTLVNGLTREIRHVNGQAAFGENYLRAGVVGPGLHGPALVQVETMTQIAGRLGYPLSINAVGGVQSAEEILRFREAGADAVFAGSSPAYLPYLARDIRTGGLSQAQGTSTNR